MIHVFSMYGLGGRIWSWAIADYVCASIKEQIVNSKVYPTMGYKQWETISDQIQALPKKDKKVVIGHSMGGSAATYPTDDTYVDLVVCYDCAGQRPVGIAKNTNRLLDFWDRAFAIVPKFRPWAYPGYSDRIRQVQTRDGHTGQPSDPALLKIVIQEIKKLG
jgi:pimeloyl-ACP methyl ester carboxylesterase